MRLELVSIETSTYPLDGAFYQPESGAGKGAILIMHGNCGNFYTGVPRHFAPLLVRLGYAVLTNNRRGHDILASSTTLIARLPTHHGKPPPLMFQATESLFAENHEHFFNSIDPSRKWSVHRSS